MKYDINKTAIIPYIIAENAVWNVIEGEEKYKALKPDEIAATIVKLSEVNNCLSALQYTDECVQCDKLFSCPVKSIYHVNGLNKRLQFETDKILKENENRISSLKNNIQITLNKIS